MKLYVMIIMLMVALGVGAESITQDVAYYGDVVGYLAMPEDASDAPALILIHEWWGINDDIRMKAREYADAGYVALAVDLYNGKSTTSPKRARALAGKVGNNRKAAFANLRAAAEFLRALPETDETRLGSVGWCFGGGWSYQIAKNNLGARASVIYYGRFNPVDDLAQMRAKIIGHFGEDDRAILIDDVEKFQARLRTHSGDHEIFIYPHAGHGFANPESSSYNADAATEAHQRTLAFLKAHL